jgi:hypothetical protein
LLSSSDERRQARMRAVRELLEAVAQLLKEKEEDDAASTKTATINARGTLETPACRHGVAVR